MIRHQTRLLDDAPLLAFQPLEGAQAPLEAVCAWLAECRDDIDAALLRHGGVLVRGFDALCDAHAFERALTATGAQLMDYVGGTSPRKQVAGRILTATEVPGSYSIPLHQEMSYTDGSPARIAFFCETPAAQGGSTTVADMRTVTRALGQDIAQAFAAQGGLQLRRNLPLPDRVAQRPGVPKPWTEVFDTTEPERAQTRATERGWRWQWMDDASMTLWQEVRPATRRHPVTGDEVWFNQVHIFAPASALQWARNDGRTEMAERMARAMRECPEFLDRFVHADGSEIADEQALHVYDVLEREAMPLNWQRGDLLILDNILMAHGRLRFSGPRRVLTALIQETSAS
jgi:alpha-ketoglutarate-dependent taurine dioxygenase